MALTAVLGLVSEVIVTVVNIINNSPTKVASYELLDSTGSSIIGGSAIRSDYAIFVKGSRRQQSRSLAASSIPWTKEERSIIIEFGDSKANAEAGVLTGFVPFSGSEQLALSTPADFAPGDYEVVIHYLAAARLNVNRGVVSVFPS